ncbi:MAG TPA: energy-coupling factor ABC transporter ATP-binding protein [Dongiaceae bacterium]|nr:energy-coupling factor ABC transporter ATP-binding protein [Dongiaceae bacterium]
MSERIVHVSCVRHTYPDRTSVHLCGLDFVVERGQRVVVLGPNGCGKSTLLYHVLGLLAPQEGEVRVFGVDPARQFSKIRERVGVLLQNSEEQIIAPTVFDDVSFSPRNYGYTDAEVERKVTAALRRVGIEHLRHKVCHYLSGGERRKVALAGALVLEPELLVLDEPFEGLDPLSRGEILELLLALNRDAGVSLVVATHDVPLVSALADKVYVLKKGGEILAQGPPADIFRDVALLKATTLEPPQLAELFQQLEARGIALGRPGTVEDAARVLIEHLRAADGRTAATRPGDTRPEASRPADTRAAESPTAEARPQGGHIP